MKKFLALTSVLLLAATVALPVLAQHSSYRYQANRYNQSSSSSNEDEADKDDYSEGYRATERRRYAYSPVTRSRGNHYAPYRYRAAVRYSYPRNYRAGTWHVDGYLPTGYFTSSNYVDYRHYRLSPPPRGYQWVRVEKDVYLVSPTSGLVRDVLYELFY